MNFNKTDNCSINKLVCFYKLTRPRSNDIVNFNKLFFPILLKFLIDKYLSKVPKVSWCFYSQLRCRESYKKTHKTYNNHKVSRICYN